MVVGEQNADGFHASGSETFSLVPFAGADSTAATQALVTQLKEENETYEARLERYRGSLPLPWVGAALLVVGVGGFLSGLWWLDALIRRRHGGFRVY